MFFIANPNNPTGTINKNDEFDNLIERIPDDLLVVVEMVVVAPLLVRGDVDII